MSDPDYQASDSDDDYESLTDASSEDECDELVNNPHVSHIEDARNTIIRHIDITNANALAINQKMQANLLLLKARLNEMLQKCRQRYEENEQTLLRKSKTHHRADRTMAPKRETSYFFYGYPFFKNTNLLSARPNADYLYRKHKLREYFPIEHDEMPKFWVILDKVYLINGVREQVINRLMVEFKDRMRKKAALTAKSKSPKKGTKEMTVVEYKKQISKKKLLELMDTMADKESFTIDWFTVSQNNLDGRHAPNTSEAIWDAYLRPSLNRQQWTAEEDDLLLNTMENCVPLDWVEVAKRMDRRSVYQCVVHYRTKLALPQQGNCGRWSAEEDALLLEMVNKYRIGNRIPWSNVETKIPSRNKQQVYQRYTMSLKPGIIKERFSVEEDCKLMAAFKEFGSNFQMYQKILPGRTTIQIRNRYNNVLTRVGKFRDWTVEDDTVLMEYVAKEGTSKWRGAADILPEHTRTSCRSRYYAITKHLAKNPNCSLSNIPRRRSKLSSEVTPDNWLEKIIVAKQSTAKLRTELELQYYHYFKFTYHYDMEIFDELPTTHATIKVCRSLKCILCPINNKLLQALPSDTIDLNHLADQPQPAKDTFLPADWNTALILRGLAIMFPDRLSANERDDVRTAVEHPALDLFRQRLTTLLANAARLSSQSKSFLQQRVANQINVEIDARLLDQAPKVYGGKKRKCVEAAETDASNKQPKT